MPEMKISGSRTTLSIDMMSPGLSVGYEVKRVPIVAKQNEVRRTPMTSGAICRIRVPKMMRPARNGTDAIPMLYRNPLVLSPRTTACREIGAEMSRSKVFIRCSIGIRICSIDEAEKRMVIAMRPGIKTDGSPGLPDREREEHEEGEEHARYDDVWFEIVDEHVLLCDRPGCNDFNPELPEPFLISQRFSPP